MNTDAPPTPMPTAAVSSTPGIVRLSFSALGGWTPTRWSIAGAAAVLTALVVGLPTDVIPNPVFGRSVPVQWWNFPTLAVTAVLGGIVLATYVSATPREPAPGDGSRLGALGGVMSFLAVGCPACNKLALLLLGASGALTYWAPLQPLVAVASIVSLAVAAVRRLSGEIACPAGPPQPRG